MWAQVLHGVPNVVTCHRLERLRRWKSAPPRGDHGLALLRERIAVEGAVAIVAVSEVVRDNLLRSYPTVETARGRRHGPAFLNP